MLADMLTKWVIRPADRWIENLAPGGRLVFWLGGPGPQREGMGGRHSNGGAALAVERRPKGYAVHPVSTAHFVCAEGDLAVGDEAEAEALAKARQGLCSIVRWADIEADPPKRLKVSPLAAVPHKS